MSWEFLLTEAGVLNPVFFVARALGGHRLLARGRRDPFQLYFFSMGAPLFLFYFLLSFHSRILANWIAPAVVPLFCLMAVYWWTRWEAVGRAAETVLAIGVVALGIFAVVMAHDTQLLDKVVAPANCRPGWTCCIACAAGRKWRKSSARPAKTLKKQGKPAFIICEHYGFTSQISFYLPEAKSRVSTDPLVFFYASAQAGQSILFLAELSQPHRTKCDLRPRNLPPRLAPRLVFPLVAPGPGYSYA